MENSSALKAHERPEERHALRVLLVQGRSILQLGPRRVGKTWVTKRLAKDLGPNWIVVMCDAQGRTTEAELLEHVCREIEASAGLKGLATGRIGQAVRNLQAGRVEAWQDLFKTDWRAFLETLVANLATLERESVIVIDELALLLLTLRQTDAKASLNFLYWLRAMRQKHPRVRWFFTGSVGLHSVARQDEVEGALVDLAITSLGPFDAAATQSYLEQLCEDGEILRPFRLGDEGFAHFVSELGWLSPYYIEQVAKLVQPSGPMGPPAPRPLATLTDIDAAFKALLQPEHKTYFSTWREHLSKNFPALERDQLRAILDRVSQQAEGELLDTLLGEFGGPPHGLTRPVLRERLDALLLDAFLLEEGDEDRPRFRFRSGLLRRYWRRYEIA
jgi:uncharacterized protein